MIFLSYAREDHELAAQLESQLRNAGLPIAKDEPQPESNPFWRTEVLRLLRDTQVLVALWSANALASPWVDQELRSFAGQRVWFCVDDTERPGRAREQNLVVRDWPSLRETLLSLVDVGGPAPERDPAPAELWRREEVRGEAQAALDRFRREPRPDVTVREIAANVFITDPGGLSLTTAFDDVLIGSAPVTVGQYRRFLNEAGLTAHPSIDLATERRDLPVVGVSWFEAVAFAEWHGGSLPTAGEWQQAAETTARLRYATATGDINPGLAWFGGQFAVGAPKPAASYPPNPAGFYGMCGNIWDWCDTVWFGHREIRGGSWMDTPAFCTVGARYRNAPVDRDCTVGFRVRLRMKKDGVNRASA